MRYEKRFYEGRNSGLQYYEIRNDMKPLVLLHAQAVDSTSFFCVMPKLARHFHVYAVDCYGHGRSLHDASRYNVAVIDFVWNVVMEPVCLLAACQKKPRRVSRPQTRKHYYMFSAATCAWQKTLCAE